MSSLETTLSAIHRRVLSRRLLLALSRGALYSLAPSAVLLAVHPFAPVSHIFLLVALLPVLGLIGGYLWYRLRAPDLDGTVHALDHRLRSFDRFLTALQCARRGERNEVERELVRTTGSAAERLKPTVLVPRGLPTETRIAALLLLFVLMGVGFLLPRWKAIELAARGVEVLREVERVESIIERALEEQRKVDPALAARLEGLLDEIHEARSLDEIFDTTREALQAVEQAAIQAGDPELLGAARSLGKVAEYLTKSQTAQDLARALSSGDVDRAAQLAERLAEEIKKTGMDPAEAARLAQALRDAADMGRQMMQQAANVTQQAAGGLQSNPSALAKQRSHPGCTGAG